MILLFIDETQCTQKNKDYFGLGVLILNSNSYKGVKSSFDKAITKLGWDSEEEFKGECIFSATKGDKTVSVDDRINLTEMALGGLTASKNARAKYSLFYNYNGKTAANYNKLLKKAVSTLKKPDSGNGKDLVIILIDGQESFDKKEIIQTIRQNIKAGYHIFEEPYFLNSKTAYCGMVLVDIWNYLKTWVVLNPTENNQLELFYRGITDNNKIKVQKAKVLLAALKNTNAVIVS